MKRSSSILLIKPYRAASGREFCLGFLSKVTTQAPSGQATTLKSYQIRQIGPGFRPTRLSDIYLQQCSLEEVGIETDFINCENPPAKKPPLRAASSYLRLTNHLKTRATLIYHISRSHF